MSKQADNIEINKRIYTIKRLILSGLCTYEIIEYIRTQTEWDIKQAQIYNYIKRASKEIEDYREQKINYIEGKSLARLEDLYQSFQKIKDYKGCLQVVKEYTDLYLKKKDNTNNYIPTPIIIKRKNDSE
jgi:hypothetical protein